MIVKEYSLYLFLIMNRSHSLIYCQGVLLRSLVLSEDFFLSLCSASFAGLLFFLVRIAQLYVSMMPFYSHVHIVFVEMEPQSQNKEIYCFRKCSDDASLFFLWKKWVSVKDCPYTKKQMRQAHHMEHDARSEDTEYHQPTPAPDTTD